MENLSYFILTSLKYYLNDATVLNIIYFLLLLEGSKAIQWSNKLDEQLRDQYYEATTMIKLL